MVQQLLPWDTLFLAGFAYSGYRTLGRWLKYTDDVAKAQSDGAYLEGFREYLSTAAQAGERSKPNPGAGAESSGQGHLWRDFGGMKTKQRIALVQEMQKVLEWTGQDGAYRELVRHRGKPWSALPHKAKKALLAAADQLDWSFLNDMAQAGAAVASSSSVWQVTEPLPQLSSEPALAERLLEDGQGLIEMVASCDIAINALLHEQQEKAISALSPAKQLKIPEVKRQLEGLREVVQGGLGLGSGGKASRGQQVLELLRGLSLTPASESDQAAKAAAAAALDSAADEAVAALQQQHATALTNATAAARHQAVMSALNARIKFSPGKPPLSAPVAAAVIDTAATELTAALSDAGAARASGADSGAAAGLAVRRLAAERVMGSASVIESTAAALAAAMGEDLVDDEEEGEAAAEQLRSLSDAASAVQDAAIKVIETKFNNKPPQKPAAAKAAASGGDEAGAEGAEEKEKEEEDTAATAAAAAVAAVAALEEALQSTLAAVAAVAAVAALPAAAAGDGDDESVTKEGVRSEIEGEVEQVVAAAEAKTKSQQETALQTARSRERMSLLLGKAKQLQTPPAAAAAAAEGGEGAAAAPAAMQPAEELQVTEEFLKQLGNRPLAAALSDLDKLLSATTSDSSDSSSSGPDSAAALRLARGIQLQPEGSAALEKLGELLSEIQVADAVMKLDLGPDISKTLDMLAAYLAAFDERAATVDAGRATPPTPSFEQQKSVALKCKEMVSALRGEGLVQLSLSTAQYRQLQTLREAAAVLNTDLDALKYDRCVTALKDVASQLGPIGVSIQTRLAATTDESAREVMQQQKTLAVELYDRLQSFLRFEEDIRGPLKKCLRELASLAGGIGAPRTASSCKAGQLKLDFAVEEAQKLQDLLSQLHPSAAAAEGAGDESAAAAPAPDSVAATQQLVKSLQGQVEGMQASLDELAGHVSLRERGLNPDTSAAAAAAGLSADDLGLPSLEEMEPQLADRGLHLTLLDAATDEQQMDWERLGFEQIARGRVASVLIATTAVDAHTLNPRGEDIDVAVEDGTPRVAVPVPGLPSGKSTLQLLAERILKLQQLAAAETFGRNAPVTRHIQWYIMTAPATHDRLSSLLKSHSFFGLQSGQVTLFKCDTAPPAFAGDPLRALMLGAGTLSRGQPGSGEVFAALKSSGALGHMKRSGVRHVEINAVDDNVLARPADPMLVGFCASEGFDAAAKVVEPDQLPAVYAAATSGAEDEEGEAVESAKALLEESITFMAPAIGSYYFSMAAVNKVAQHMAAHPLAGYRLVPVSGLPSKAPPPQLTVNLPPNATQAQRMQAQQALIAAQQAAANAPPKQVDGWVPTRLISDIFVSSSAIEPPTPTGGSVYGDGAVSPLEGSRLALLGVAKFQEFSPLLGSDPHLAVPHLDQAAGDLLSLTTGWVEEQGGVIECEEGVEVAPLVSYSGEGLEPIVDGLTFAEPFDLALQGATGAGKPKHNAGPWAVPVLGMYAVGAGLAVLKQLAGNRS